MSKLTAPKDMIPNINEESDIMRNMFEIEFKNKMKGGKYYHIVIRGEFSRGACDRIQSAYEKAGWFKAICKTSSENGERYGLTGLQLYVDQEIYEKCKPLK